MVETAKFADVTVEKIEEEHVIMAVGVGDRNVCNILFGRKPFVKAAADAKTAAEIRILRVDVANEEELNELKTRVHQAKGELDPGVEHPPIAAKKKKVDPKSVEGDEEGDEESS